MNEGTNSDFYLAALLNMNLIRKNESGDVGEMQSTTQR